MSERPVSGASSARKMLHVLFCFTADKPLWSVAELCRELDVSTSTMYRYVALLREVGLLDTANDNSYRISSRIQTLAAAAEQAGTPLETVALPVMTRIRDLIGETVLISRRNKSFVYCIDRVESEKPVRLQFDRGQPMSLHKGSMARLLLASMPLSEREGYLSGVLPGLSDKEAALLSEESLEAVRQAGYTQSFEEIDEGIWGAAASITLHGHSIAAIGVAAPMYRLDARMREVTITALRQGADEISRALAADS